MPFSEDVQTFGFSHCVPTQGQMVAYNKIIPQPESLDEWRDGGPIQSLVRWQGSIQHTIEQDWKLASRRQSRDIRRDWRKTSTPTTPKICGKWSKPSHATKAGARPCVRPRCQMSLIHFMLALISSTSISCQIYSASRRVANVIHSGCEKNPAESNAGGPSKIPGHVLRTCADQLVDVISDIYNISTALHSVLTHLENNTIYIRILFAIGRLCWMLSWNQHWLANLALGAWMLHSKTGY